MTAKWIAAALIVGAVVGIGLTRLDDNRKIVALQAHADTVAAQRRTADSLTVVWANMMAWKVDSLQKAKRPVTVKISQDSAAANAAAEAVAHAKTASDSNVALVAEVASLASENAGLRTNARTDSLSLWAAMARGDSLERDLRKDGAAIADLNARIQALNHKALPRWLDLGFGVAQKVLAVKGLVDVARGR